MKSIGHQQATAHGRVEAIRKRTRDCPGVGRGGPATEPASQIVRLGSVALVNWTTAANWRVDAASFGAPTFGHHGRALVADRDAFHLIPASFSADCLEQTDQAHPRATLAVQDSVDPQEGCEEGCFYCNGPETD
ncbi:hypothetical protein GCM10023346_48370 [Arthrobacter gyeryongensis]|uniref:Uncharacterized protein n=2 Tax=Arthrobacter gyeryongensis TaxID=1650592 RepID=A0ABP9SW01_9MICC